MPTTKAGHNKEGKTMQKVIIEAERLDEIYPYWWKKIDLDYLKMGYEDSCILGQLYPSFCEGMLDINFRRNDGVDAGDIEFAYGINAPEGQWFSDYWEELRVAWSTEIVHRLDN